VAAGRPQRWSWLGFADVGPSQGESRRAGPWYHRT